MYLKYGIALFIILIIIGAILTWLNKRKMEKGLGRKVDKLQANSISNWMEVADKEEESRK